MLLRCDICSGAVPVQVVPKGIESVNGSDTNMGCTSPLSDKNGVMVCQTTSYLLDGNSPAINTSTSNWASQLVTLRKNKPDDIVDFHYGVLTFDFDTAVSPTSVELDMILCPEWNIGAAGIFLFADQNSNLVFSHVFGETQSDFLRSSYFAHSSCDSLLTVTFPLKLPRQDSYHSWHFLVDFYIDFEWMHIAEVRFIGVSTDPNTPKGKV